MKLAHIINPVNVPAGTELGIAQPITFESIRRANLFCNGTPAVELYAVSYAEDAAIIPDWVKQLPLLQRSVLQVGQFTTQRKYPLMADVLQALYDATDADYLIYTNMDIALMPHFYTTVMALLQQGGHDALVINRRGISRKYKTVEQLPDMYADFGVPHPGFDCFVFSRHLLPKLQLADICLGVSFSEVAMMHNFIAYANNLRLVDDLHLTFHIGTEVMPPLNPEYYNHNRRQYEERIYPVIKPLLQPNKFPYSQLPLHKRMLKWMLNPSFRTYRMAKLEGLAGWRAVKYYIDGFRFWLLNAIR